MDQDWVERWRDTIRRDVKRFVEGFESRFGYPPGPHEVLDAAPPANVLDPANVHSVPRLANPTEVLERNQPRQQPEPFGPDPANELAVFYSVVAEVRLPDVHNGYWIHPLGDHGHPHALSDGRAVTVFGTDGGGTLFALTADGSVLSLSGGALIDGIYDADGAKPAADNLQEFLTFLHDQVRTSAA